MKRWAVLASSTLVAVLAGCLGEMSYNERLENTLNAMKYEQKLNTYLNKPEQGSLKEKEVLVRVPKELVKDPQLLLHIVAGTYDAAESFSDTANGMRLHVLARWKKPPPRPQTKKGGPPPPEPAQRGPFDQDIRSLLSATYGADVPSTQPESFENRPYKRLLFKSAIGNDVQAYLYDAGNHVVALIWDIPAAAKASKAYIPGKQLTLGSLAVGNAARAGFEGRSETGASGGSTTL